MKKMMNVVSLCLVVTSLVTAGVLSPTPKKQNNGDDLIVKEGHRVVVVEYDQEGQPITKVSISPEDKTRQRFNSDKLKEAVSVLPNLGQGLSTPKTDGGGEDEGDGEWRSPKELICDAYGKCKHKIVDAIGRTKEAVSEKAHDVGEKTKETKEKAEDVVEKAKEAVSEKARGFAEKTRETGHEAQDAAERKAHEVVEKTKEAAHEAVEKKKKAAHRMEEAAEESYGKAKEAVRNKAQEVEGQARERAEKTWEAVKDAKDVGKTFGKDVAGNVTEFAATFRKQAGATFRELVTGKALNLVVGVVYLVAFSTAYGTAVWETFILSYVLAGALPRQQFGVVQSKIYPVYFRTMAWGIGTAVLGLLVTDRGKAFSSMAEKFQIFNLLASLVLVFVNMLYLEPRATKVTIIIIFFFLAFYEYIFFKFLS